MADGNKSREELEQELRVLRERLKELEGGQELVDEEPAGLSPEKEGLDFQELPEDLLRKDRLTVLGQVAGSIGHEVLNPLGVVKNSAYYLRMITSPDDEKVLKHINIIEREVERARKIVTDLLDLTRTAPQEREEADPARLMDEAVHLADVPPDMEIARSYQVNMPRITCDPQQMAQVFINLLTNSVQCLAGEKSPRIKLSVYTQEEAVRVEVEDNGPGIPEDQLDRIFEPLFSSKTWGFGLGLTVCRQLVSINGGEIKAENRHEKGARFVVSFPVEKD
ncbi:MAG: ATP-binding protein [bacterium]